MFWHGLITVDEAWKQQSIQWTRRRNRFQKSGKVMATVFWEKDILIFKQEKLLEEHTCIIT